MLYCFEIMTLLNYDVSIYIVICESLLDEFNFRFRMKLLIALFFFVSPFYDVMNGGFLRKMSLLFADNITTVR